jgi:hypothetical protein
MVAELPTTVLSVIIATVVFSGLTVKEKKPLVTNGNI